MSEPLTRMVLAVAINTDPVRRQRVFVDVPPDTFKGGLLGYRLARFFATDTATAHYEEMAYELGLDPVALAALVELSFEDEGHQPLEKHMMRLLASRVGAALAAGLDFTPYAAAIVRINEAARSEMVAPGIPPFDLSRIKTASDIRTGDYPCEYVCDKLIPKGAITMLYGDGGIGKTTVGHQLGHAISDGTPFLGLQTQKLPVVFIDAENPMGVLKKGLDRIKGGDGVYYWTTTDNPPPPQLDGPEWELLKSLVATVKNLVLFIDTLQGVTNSLDITSNSDFTPVMARLKLLRDMGATIVILHHTPKNDATTYVGASVIYNQSDHILAMYAVKEPGGDQAAMKSDDETRVYRFGTRGKTRYGHHAIYLMFDQKSCLFKEVTSPETEGLNVIQTAMVDLHETTSVDLKVLLAALKNSGCAMDISEHHVRKLLKKGEGVYWETSKGLYNKTLYSPLPNSLNGTQTGGSA